MGRPSIGWGGRRSARRAPVSLRAALCLAAAGAALAAAPDGATARRSATFRVQVTGTSSSSATLKPEGCTVGTSSQSATFRAAPFTIRVDEPGPFTIITGLSPKGEDGRQYFLISGMVTQSNAGELACKDNPELPQDCGTKPFTGVEMLLQGESRGSPRFDFNLTDGLVAPKPLFENCYTATGWLGGVIGVGRAGHGTDVFVSKSALFDRHRQTIVATGTSSSEGEGGYGASVKASGKVTLTLTRVGGLRRPGPSPHRHA